MRDPFFISLKSLCPDFVQLGWFDQSVRLCKSIREVRISDAGAFSNSVSPVLKTALVLAGLRKRRFEAREGWSEAEPFSPHGGI